MVTSKTHPVERQRITICGQVQGVGFRPYVHRLAKRFALSGWIQNTVSGITLEIQGHQLSEFLCSLPLELPPLAKLSSIDAKSINIQADETQFIILESEAPTITAVSLIPVDTSPCEECLQELFDPDSRYFHYPFLNCTNCGPRLSIIRQLPYDRKHTTMAPFTMCSLCQTDYHDIKHRRYHAQAIACPHCGPKLAMPVEEIAASIQAGEIVALKGIGGYQLICNARDESAVLKLRARKQRDSKPFALMALNTQSVKQFVDCDLTATALLQSPSRPIVLLPKKKPENYSTPHLPSSLAPGLSCFGIMLPNSPLHYLLFYALRERQNKLKWMDEIDPSLLVVTSANLSGEPLFIEDLAAKQHLANIADVTVSYNREIINRLDDSVVSIIQRQPCFIRRARGYVPQCITLACDIPPMLAVGGFLKNTICVTRGNEAFLSQHIGNLKTAATIDFFHDTINQLLNALNVVPSCIAHDLHPDFHSSSFAKAYGLPTIAVQHHHAHLAAVMAEYHLMSPVLGLALDGHGLGSDGSLWGGELFMLENTSQQRLSSFTPLPLPGGEIAAREPWRMAISAAFSLNKPQEILNRFGTAQNVSVLKQMLEKNVNSPKTSSCGRLFDAAAGILCVSHISRYEAEAAMKLESLVTEPTIFSSGWTLQDNMLNLLPTLNKLLDLSPVEGANMFHGTLIAALKEWIMHWSQKTQIKTVVLSGGCFLNKILTEGLMTALSAENFKIYLPRCVPPNDAGLSLGQAWVGGLILR